MTAWARHDGDRYFHAVAIADSGTASIPGSTVTECAGRWPAGDDVERSNNPPPIERCRECRRVLATKGTP